MIRVELVKAIRTSTVSSLARLPGCKAFTGFPPTIGAQNSGGLGSPPRLYTNALAFGQPLSRPGSLAFCLYSDDVHLRKPIGEYGEARVLLCLTTSFQPVLKDPTGLAISISYCSDNIELFRKTLPA